MCSSDLAANVGNVLAVSWALTANQSVDAAAQLSMRACWGPSLWTDRPWRKPAKQIGKDQYKTCSVPVAAAGKIAPGAAGEFAWKVGANVPGGIFTLQIQEQVGGVWTGYGRGAGYFSATQIDSTPPWLVTMTACFICIGPLTLAAFLTWERRHLAATRA